MWILRAPVRTTLLLQGSKLGPQGTAKGRKMENVCWVKKQKWLWCAFCEHLSGSHFCRKDLSWDSRRQPKEWKWEISDGQKTQTTFMWILRAPVRITILPQGSKLGPQGATKGMIIEDVWLVKNINEVHTIPLWRHFLHQDHGKSHLIREGLILKAENCK